MKKIIKVLILGTEYKIQTAEQEFLRKLCESDGFVFGLCDYEHKLIYLDNKISKGEYIKTLRHELVHAFFFESGLDLQSDYARQEELVDWIALQLPKMIKVCEKLKAL